MDNLEIKLDERIVDEPSPIAVDVIQLSQEDREKVKLLESQAIIGNRGTIHETIVNKFPDSYKVSGETIDSFINLVPAWGFYFYDQDNLKFVVLVNTDLVKDTRLIPVLLQHEAVEGIMQDKDLDIQSVASQIGVDPETIKNDPYNDAAHYVALYHELKTAHDMGILDEVVEYRRKTAGSIVRDVILPMSKLNGNGSQNPDWKQTFKDSSGEYAKLNFIVPKQIAERIRSNVK